MQHAADLVKAFLPAGAALLMHGGRPAVDTGDMDGDGMPEIAAAYRLGDTLYVLVLKHQNGNWQLAAQAEGKGYDLSYFRLAPVVKRGQLDVLVGWQIAGIWSSLSIYHLTASGLQDAVPPETLFSWMEAEDMPSAKGYDGRWEIAMWKHVTGEAYEVEVYQWKKGALVQAPDVYPYYFPRVIQYYQARIQEMPDAAFYWYYLADAWWKAGYPADALKSVNYALQLPSAEGFKAELEKLKAQLLGQRVGTLHPAPVSTVKGVKWGYIDEAGQLVIPPQYGYAFPFQKNGLAAVEYYGLYGLITMSGAFAVPPRYGTPPEFSEGRAAVVEGKGYHVINERGVTLTKKAYDYISPYKESRAMYSGTNEQGEYLSGYLDRQGREVTPLQYKNANDFSSGKAVVQLRDLKYALIDRNGNVLQTYPYPFVGNLSEGLLPFQEKENGRFGYIDETGRVVLPPAYTGAQLFSEGRAVVNMGEDYKNSYGVIDRSGRFVIPATYNSIQPLGNQCIAVGKAIDEKQPFIGSLYAIADVNGVFVTDFVYRDVMPYKHGLASVYDGKRTFFIDGSGKAVPPVVEGNGTLRIEGNLVEANVDYRQAYYTKNGQLVWKQSMTISLPPSYTVQEETYKPRPDYVVYYPSISGMKDKAAERQVNAELKRIAQRKPIDTDEQMAYTHSGDYEIAFFQKDLLVLKLSTYTYPLGAAHGMPTQQYVHINLVTGEMYALQDLFQPGSDYVKVLSDIVAEQIKTDPQYDYLFPDAYKGIRADQPFYVDDKALYLYFDPYEIGPYAAGFPTFKIPYERINSILNTNGSFWRSFH